MREYLILVWELAKSDFKLRYINTKLGLLWAILLPFIMFSVLYTIFTQFIHTSTDTTYVFLLLLGIILWSFFFDATTKSIDNLIGKRNLIRNIPFPISAAIAATCLDSFVVLLIHTGIFVGALLLMGHPLSWSWAVITMIFSGFFAFTLGISYFLSTINIVYRDIKHVWLAVLQIGFFLSPVFYTASVVPTQYRELYLLNPIALTIQQSRQLFLYNKIDYVSVSMVLLVGIILAILGSIFVNRLQYTIRQEL